jgi:hypothetical protein
MDVRLLTIVRGKDFDDLNERRVKREKRNYRFATSCNFGNPPKCIQAKLRLRLAKGLNNTSESLIVGNIVRKNIPSGGILAGSDIYLHWDVIRVAEGNDDIFCEVLVPIIWIAKQLKIDIETFAPGASYLADASNFCETGKGE